MAKRSSFGDAPLIIGLAALIAWLWGKKSTIGSTPTPSPSPSPTPGPTPTPAPATKYYSISRVISPANVGRFIIIPDKVQYAEGERVDISVETTNPLYVFDHFGGDTGVGDYYGQSMTWYMKSNRQVVAVFKAAPLPSPIQPDPGSDKPPIVNPPVAGYYHLDINTNYGKNYGLQFVRPEDLAWQRDFAPGTEIEVLAEPAESFKYWYVWRGTPNGSTAEYYYDNPLPITMDGQYIITAYYD